VLPPVVPRGSIGGFDFEEWIFIEKSLKYNTHGGFAV
jgi:hypothetical protein